MSTDTTQRSGNRRKLYFEILKDLAAALVVAAFTFFFLYYSSHSIVENYITHRGIHLMDVQMSLLDTWLKSLCIAAASIIFICMFLVLFTPHQPPLRRGEKIDAFRQLRQLIVPLRFYIKVHLALSQLFYSCCDLVYVFQSAA